MTEKEFARAVGGEFVTRKGLAEALHYKDPHSVDKYLKGLRSYGGRYVTRDVYIRVALEGRTNEEGC